MTHYASTAPMPRLLAVSALGLAFHIGCVGPASVAEIGSNTARDYGDDSGTGDEGADSETTEAPTTTIVADDEPSDASSSEPTDATETVTATAMSSEGEMGGGGTAHDSLEPSSDVEESGPFSADAGIVAPDCTEVCTLLVKGCGGTLKNCVDECRRDAANRASCGQQAAWSVQLACCTRVPWSRCDGQGFDACRHGACDSMRPEGAAEGYGQPLCGNGEVDPDEVCDDGNTTNNDGCFGDCSRVDPNW